MDGREVMNGSQSDVTSYEYNIESSLIELLTARTDDDVSYQ